MGLQYFKTTVKLWINFNGGKLLVELILFFRKKTTVVSYFNLAEFEKILQLGNIFPQEGIVELILVFFF